jgi:arabinogalactan oligomer/maltooligosaccharide transport system substrate-binding protein
MRRDWGGVGIVAALGVVMALAGSGASVAQGQTTVTLGTLMLNVGESGIVEGRIECGAADGCGAFAMALRFDPAIIRADLIEAGPYLGADVFLAERTVDNQAGIARLAAVAMGATPELGEPVLLRLHVTALAPGVATLTVTELLVSDLAGNAVTAVGIAGAVVVTAAVPTPPPPADSDGDGVPDDRDQCPNQGDQGYGLSGNGCPNAPPTATPAAGSNASLAVWLVQNDAERAVTSEYIAECAAELGIASWTYEQISFSDASAMYLTSAAAGVAPDILLGPTSWVPGFASQGILLDLTDQVGSSEREAYIPVAFDAVEWQGRVWGLPWTVDTLALLYNKALFEEAGFEGPNESWSIYDFIDTAVGISETFGGEVYGFTLTDGVYFFQPLMWAFGGGLIDEDDLEIHVNDSGTIDALYLLLEFTEAGLIPPYDPANQYSNAVESFKDGTAAMIFNGPWAIADILSGPAFADCPDCLGVAVIPPGDGGQGSPSGATGYMISAASRYPNEALALVRCMNTPERQMLLVQDYYPLPALRAAITEYHADSDIMLGFLAQLEVSISWSTNPIGDSIYGAFSPAFDQVMTGELAPEEAMDQVAEAWAAMLAEASQ